MIVTLASFVHQSVQLKASAHSCVSKPWHCS